MCSIPGVALCAPCTSALVRLAPPVCERCGAPGAWPVRRCSECAGRRLAFATARAAIAYDDRARSLVHAWKEKGRRDLAAPLAMLVVGVVPRPTATTLTFVPGDHERGLRRGHVPAARLAAELGRRWALPVHEFLCRTRPADRQRGLGVAARRRNVRGAFAAAAAPARICLVDDVYTTGSTVAACASALRRAGARRVDVVCLARVLR